MRRADSARRGDGLTERETVGRGERRRVGGVLGPRLLDDRAPEWASAHAEQERDHDDGDHEHADVAPFGAIDRRDASCLTASRPA